jgi:hypothetical protein
MTVTVPGPDYRMSPAQAAVWDAFGAFIGMARRALPNDGGAYTVLLSRLSREMRREYGLEDAKAAFHGIADTMEEAAKFDE